MYVYINYYVGMAIMLLQCMFCTYNYKHCTFVWNGNVYEWLLVYSHQSKESEMHKT